MAPPQGAEFRVNVTTAGDQKQPTIAPLVDGGFVVAWLDNGQSGLFARRYLANGNATGGEFRIKTLGTGFSLDAAGLTTGGFVVAWHAATDGEGVGIFARRFDATGTAVGNPFLVNTNTAGAQWYAAVAAQGGGAFVVAWASDPQDGSSSGVYAQRFTSAGAAGGAEFRVNVRTAGLQSFPAVAAVGSGLAVTWTSDQQDGSNQGVFGRLYGDTGAGVITGTSGPDNLLGTAGNDVIDGKGGADVMTGLAGNDTYIVNDAGDAVVEAASEGTDTVRSSVTYTLPAHVEKIILTGTTAINGTGNALANTLTGNGTNNVLNGKGGADTLTGKAGQDRFLFNTALGLTNVDRITDFSPVDDTIRLENAVFTALTTTGALAASAFKVGTAATTAAHRIVYDPATGSVYYDPDGTGAAAKKKFATLTTKPTLTNADFVVQ
jgi:Ca2+-binding RTX toxin-like protein